MLHLGVAAGGRGVGFLVLVFTVMFVVALSVLKWEVSMLLYQQRVVAISNCFTDVEGSARLLGGSITLVDELC